MIDKKKEQLGMNPSTAQGRLVKDILWSLIVKTGQTVCCKCGKEMHRETFSIEHLVPWLDSEDPVGLFFDLDNISFSHLKCNITDIRRKQTTCGTSRMYKSGCRCEKCVAYKVVENRGVYTPEKRRERYLRKGY